KALEDARSEIERYVQQGDGKVFSTGDQLNSIEPPKEQAESLLRSDRKGMNSQLLELGAAKARVASLQAGEARRATETNDSAAETPEAVQRRVQDQGRLLADKDDRLEADDGQREELRTERTQRERD
ncbi:MAG TPA: hypothetical protein VLD83_01530, partial [Candidatus Binatia bacterium]|nr:hypothetical protein [Candidatus Binatia bacterium]